MREFFSLEILLVGAVAGLNDLISEPSVRFKGSSLLKKGFVKQVETKRDLATEKTERLGLRFKMLP